MRQREKLLHAHPRPPYVHNGRQLARLLLKHMDEQRLHAYMPISFTLKRVCMEDGKENMRRKQLLL